MSKPRKSLKKPRQIAFVRQNGKCCYCHQPMWNANPTEYAERYCLSAGLTSLMRCTGEHLNAHKDGGSTQNENIAAACLFCNTQRHKLKNDVTPEKFETYVLKRLHKGAWHGLKLTC